MKNSTSLKGRIEEYRKDGWKVDEKNRLAYKEDEIGKISRYMAPDGEFDTWLPLPEDTSKKPTDHEKRVSKAVSINEKIKNGDIDVVIDRGLPSAWIDHEGLNRNFAIYTKALKHYKDKVEAQIGKLYVRKGCRFVKFKVES